MMLKFLLLALACGLSQASLEGKWKSVAIAADNINKILPSGPMRLYCREITCEDDCKRLKVTFYVNQNGQCSMTTVTGYIQDDQTYKTQFEGDNHFAPVKATPDNIVFYSENLDRAGQKTKLVFVVGHAPLTPDQRMKLSQYVEEKGIPSSNIQDVLMTDVCPQ